MINLMRRLAATALAVALVMGALPPEANAQAVRIAAGETGGMPVSPAGASVNGGPDVSRSDSGMTRTTTLNVGAASLPGSFAGRFSAPVLAPSPITAPPAFQPTASNAAVAAALSGAVRAAAAPDAPKRPDASSAAAPVYRPAQPKKTWGGRLAGLLGLEMADASATAPAAVEAAPVDFDGSAGKISLVSGPAVSAGEAAPARPSGLKAKISAKIALYAAKRAARVDEFGGPRTAPMTFKRRAGFGVKWGLNLVGIGALLDFALKPLLEVFPWPQYLSDEALRVFGRVALLTKYGPNEIAESLANAPAVFLGFNLPAAVAIEELTFRLLGFGLTFLVIAAVKPFTRRLAAMIGDLPDAAGAVGGAKLLLRVGEKISHLAFPIAAVLSSAGFALAHFEKWGVDPYVMILNLALGLALAHAAYMSRSLTAPFVAHTLFNLVTLGAILVGLTFSPATALAYSIIAGLLGVSSLLYNYLSARKKRAFTLKNGAKALAALLIVGAGLSLWGGQMNDTTRLAASSRASYAAALQLGASPTTAVPMPAVPTAAVATPQAAPATVTAPAEVKIESREDMIARVKPAVVNVIVRTPGEKGYMIGSGFILTAEGVFITNAHVVGDRRPGEPVNARLPGVPGELTAKVLAVNHDKDLAIVQLAPRWDGKPWPTVKLAPRAPREGEPVTAMGYPRGLPFTVTHGIVSGLDGRGSMYVKHLQTDAAINPGNSGGPLFNAKGEVVGVNSQIYTQSGGSEGLGFSIAAPEVARAMAQYAKTGDISTAALGIIANLSDPAAPEAGLEIEYVRRGSAAERAGLKRLDLIIEINNAEINEGGRKAADQIGAALSKMIPGETATVKVLRGDEPVTLSLTSDAKITEASRH